MKCRKCKSSDVEIAYENTKTGKMCVCICNVCIKARYIKSKYLSMAKTEFKGHRYLKENRRNIKLEKRIERKKREPRVSNNPNFYKSLEWRVLRSKVISTYGRQCMLCETRFGEMHVDHIKPRSKYPRLELEFNNLQVLCKKCNLDKSNLHEIDFREFRLPSLY